MSRQLQAKRRKYDPEVVGRAVEIIKSGTMTLGQASKTYKIPKTTLNDRVRGKYATDHIGAKTVLSADEEQRIANWVVHMSRVGYGRTSMSCVRLSRRLSMTLAEKPLFSKTNRDGNGCVGFLSVIRICPSAQLSN
ncbi:hypothetical protein DPMN_059624 [Dreissena polymorpha]|uniref:HTH psq-type domain-containing protein n=1 Tax=Dreissena polymorpha TaxID=45954 RepID=A0A9D4C3U1_DREPO|nr:hypothetical protein DPMN_059624 [Dreissena polymorpha]